MAGANVGPPGGGLRAANAGAAAAPAGPPGGAVAACEWEVWVRTFSQERFFPGHPFNHELRSRAGNTVGGVAYSEAAQQFANKLGTS